MSSTGRGIQVEYPTITLHAVSRAESGPSIYCQLDENAGAVDTEAAPSADAEDDDVSPMRELSIVPKDAASRMSYSYLGLLYRCSLYCPVDAIFEALSYCASLHPDPAGDDDMDDDDDAFVDASAFETFNGDEGEELSEVGRVRSNFVNDNRYAPY